MHVHPAAKAFHFSIALDCHQTSLMNYLTRAMVTLFRMFLLEPGWEFKGGTKNNFLLNYLKFLILGLNCIVVSPGQANPNGWNRLDNSSNTITTFKWWSRQGVCKTQVRHSTRNPIVRSMSGTHDMPYYPVQFPVATAIGCFHIAWNDHVQQ